MARKPFASQKMPIIYRIVVYDGEIEIKKECG